MESIVSCYAYIPLLCSFFLLLTLSTLVMNRLQKSKNRKCRTSKEEVPVTHALPEF